MADVTINYEGNAIATMSASGTKTLLTEGKYCTDDIEVVYVSPGGGGSTVISGSFTPAENTLSVTLSALAGTTLEHFYFKPHGNSASALNNGVRVIGPGFIQWTTGAENIFASASNAAGTSFNTYLNNPSGSSSTQLSLDRSTGVLTTDNSSGGGYLVGGMTYDFWMW